MQVAWPGPSLTRQVLLDLPKVGPLGPGWLISFSDSSRLRWAAQLEPVILK